MSEPKTGPYATAELFLAHTESELPLIACQADSSTYLTPARRAEAPFRRDSPDEEAAALSALAWQHRYVSSFRRDPRRVGEQRASVAGCLARWGVDEGRAADAVLVVSELLTNAVLYGTADTVVLSVWCTPDEVCVEVDDRTPGTWPARACPADDDENGRGLFLVRALSTAWGISEDGAVVWCSVATLAAGGAG